MWNLTFSFMNIWNLWKSRTTFNVALEYYCTNSFERWNSNICRFSIAFNFVHWMQCTVMLHLYGGSVGDKGRWQPFGIQNYTTLLLYCVLLVKTVLSHECIHTIFIQKSIRYSILLHSVVQNGTSVQMPTTDLHPNARCTSTFSAFSMMKTQFNGHCLLSSIYFATGVEMCLQYVITSDFHTFLAR